jgi:hypothetical protein
VRQLLGPKVCHGLAIRFPGELLRQVSTWNADARLNRGSLLILNWLCDFLTLIGSNLEQLASRLALVKPPDKQRVIAARKSCESVRELFRRPTTMQPLLE